MVKDNTVIVVGAGASKEFGLPIGSELLYEVSKVLRISREGPRIDDEIIDSALEIYTYKFKPHDPYYGQKSLISAAKNIIQAIPLSLSIDNLIDERKDKDIEVCAKIGIAKTILDAEKNSTIYFNPKDSYNLDFEKSKQTWLNHIFKIIKQNCDFDSLPERLDQVKFIVFNYDRCVEHYIYNAIQNAYSVNEYEAKRCMQHLDVYHPYGKVGSLPWMDNENPIEFGESIKPDKLVSLLNELKTFTEGIDKQESEILWIRKSISEATTVLFLGFGYHSLNLRLLYSDGFKHVKSNKVKYFGTTLGESDSNHLSIHSELSELADIYKEQVCLNKLAANKIIIEYWRELSLSKIFKT